MFVEHREGGPFVVVDDLGERPAERIGGGIEVARVRVTPTTTALRTAGCGVGTGILVVVLRRMGDDVGQAEFGTNGGDNVCEQCISILA